MSTRLPAALLLAALALPAWGQVDPSAQNLLASLVQGSPVTLVTPLSGGMMEVTTFTPPAPMSPIDAAFVIESARQRLAAFGVSQPTGQQFATALIGGTLVFPTGSTTVPGLLSRGPASVPVQTQVMASGTLPQVLAPAPSAAAGGTVSSTPGAVVSPGFATGRSVPTPITAPAARGGAR